MDFNVHEAKANLSKILELVQKGEKVYFCKRNVRIAEVSPVHSPRIPGAAKGLIDDALVDIPLDEETNLMSE